MSKILVALDVPTVEEASELGGDLVDHVAGFKVGLQLLARSGARAVEVIARLGKPVFADAKLHDIPNTVERAASQLASVGARWVTAHASGGRDMIAAAVTGMGRPPRQSGVLAVTVLTSLSEGELDSVGIRDTLSEQVSRLAGLAARSGAEGVVCSPGEAGIVKSTTPELVVVTPGIRLGGGDIHDQRRVASPEAAVEAGADYLVIGRAITGASDPAQTAEMISKSIALLA